jgi:hypothetical protein
MNLSSGGPTSVLSACSCGLASKGESMGDSRLRGVNDGSSSSGVDQVVRRPKGLRGVFDAPEGPSGCSEASAEGRIIMTQQLTLGAGTDSAGVLAELLVNPDRLANRSEILSRSPRPSSGPVEDIIDVTLLILLTSDGFLLSKAAISLIDVEEAP